MIYHLALAKKYSWQKKHSQNLSGSSQAYKPNKISKKKNLKIMRLGKIKLAIFIFVFFF